MHKTVESTMQNLLDWSH